MLSHRPWSTESVLWLTVLLLQAFCGVLLLSLAIEWLAEGVNEPARSVLRHVPSTVAFYVACIGFIGLFLRRNSLSWSEAFGLKHGRFLRVLGLSIGVLILIFPITLGLLWVSMRLMEWGSIEPVAQQTVTILRSTQEIWPKVVMGIVAVVMAPVVEELLFRGVFYPTIKQAGHPRLALVGTSLVFGAIHGNMMTFIPLVFLAIVLAELYESANNLFAPILTHALFNATNFGWLLLEGVDSTPVTGG